MTSYAAGVMASRKAEGMLAPLLESDDDSSTDDSSYDSAGSAASAAEKVKQTPLQKLKSATVYAGLLGGTALSAAAAVMAPSVAVFVMGGLCVLK